MSKNTIIIEGFVKDKKSWKDKGWFSKVDVDGGPYETVAFTNILRVPRFNVRVAIHGNRGLAWFFAEKWEYLAPPPGKTKDLFSVKSDSEIEAAFVRRMRSLNEFSADDFHTVEILYLVKKLSLIHI